MINSNLFTFRNALVIGVFALLWQVIFAKANAYMHAREAQTA